MSNKASDHSKTGKKPTAEFYEQTLAKAEGNAEDIMFGLQIDRQEKGAICKDLVAALGTQGLLGKSFKESDNRDTMWKAVEKVMGKYQEIISRVPTRYRDWCDRAFRAMAKAENAKYAKKVKQEKKDDDTYDARKRRRRSPTSPLSLPHRPSPSTISNRLSTIPKREYPILILEDADEEEDPDNMSCTVERLLPPDADKSSDATFEQVSWRLLLEKLRMRMAFDEAFQKLVWTKQGLSITVVDDDSLVVRISDQWRSNNSIAIFQIKEKRRPTKKNKVIEQSAANVSSPGERDLSLHQQQQQSPTKRVDIDEMPDTQTSSNEVTQGQGTSKKQPRQTDSNQSTDESSSESEELDLDLDLNQQQTQLSEEEKKELDEIPQHETTDPEELYATVPPT
ncbi:MAG: hypothetical protein Q9187_000873 [Circinaria calcarea]